MADPASKAQQFAAVLRAALPRGAVYEDLGLGSHTTLRVGGVADLAVIAEDIRTLQQAVSLAWDWSVPCRVLGAGSNVLVSDEGVNGLVVLNRARGVQFGPAQVRAESGALLSAVARLCVERDLAGLEWAVGIPGTIGGAVVGNAGAWGSDTAATLTAATMLEPGSGLATWEVSRFEYGYRTSILKKPGTESERKPVVLEAEFALRPEERRVLKRRVREIAQGRRASQPSGHTCGSIFRNPPGDHAGWLIEAAGLKGRRVGGAEISAVHANFIVNCDGATAADVRALIDLAREAVWKEAGVQLELEIELIGEWSASG
jgi:UDP-N-acetylmuramate dehydrogenase